MTNYFSNHPNLPWLKDRTILLVKHGSFAYGTNLPGSDLDIRGVTIAPMEYYLGFTKNFEQAETKGDPDIVIYDIRKIFKLAAEANPNIFEILFSHSDSILMETSLGYKLRANARMFLSKKIKRTYLGYATSMIRRIMHNKESPDWKDAMHLVRLMRMGIEILETGNVIVKRPDAAELLEIRAGKWRYDQVLSYAHEMELKIQSAAEKSWLPDTPDYDKLESLLVELINEKI